MHACWPWLAALFALHGTWVAARAAGKGVCGGAQHCPSLHQRPWQGTIDGCCCMRSSRATDHTAQRRQGQQQQGQRQWDGVLAAHGRREQGLTGPAGRNAG
jgi:hypothetical protein